MCLKCPLFRLKGKIFSVVKVSKTYAKTWVFISPSMPRCEGPVSYTHLRAHETGRNLVCRLLLTVLPLVPLVNEALKRNSQLHKMLE